MNFLGKFLGLGRLGPSHRGPLGAPVCPKQLLLLCKEQEAKAAEAALWDLPEVPRPSGMLRVRVILHSC